MGCPAPADLKGLVQIRRTAPTSVLATGSERLTVAHDARFQSVSSEKNLACVCKYAITNLHTIQKCVFICNHMNSERPSPRDCCAWDKRRYRLQMRLKSHKVKLAI